MLAFADLFVIVGTSLTCALLALVMLFRPQWPSATTDGFKTEPMTFLFDDGVLHHASMNALASFTLVPGAHLWTDLRATLLRRFPLIPEKMDDVGTGSMTILPDNDQDPGILTLRWRDSMCWIELSEDLHGLEDPPEVLDRYSLFKQVCETSPHPSWQTDATGEIQWRNASYQNLRDRVEPDFPFPTNAEKDETGVIVDLKDGETEWYSLRSIPYGEGKIHHATSVTEEVRSANAQRTFVQALAKTFAHLPIGLAIFDRNRQLNIFNPALVDLTGLKPQFLAKQPTIFTFFDALRENRRMPEPKNYTAWRSEISDMVAAAADDHYDEIWTLEDGRTYTVQGRAHPDGAIAFLFEDISAEVLLTRNYRAEVHQYEALLDTISDPLIMFSSDGVVLFSNAAYHQAWGQNPEAAFADVKIADTIEVWQNAAQADWGQVSEFIRTLGAREESEVPISDGPNAIVAARLVPVESDATIVQFQRSLSGTASASSTQTETHVS